MTRVEGDEAFSTHMVDNQAIVVPETIDAIRALTGPPGIPGESVAKTERGGRGPVRSVRR